MKDNLNVTFRLPSGSVINVHFYNYEQVVNGWTDRIKMGPTNGTEYDADQMKGGVVKFRHDPTGTGTDWQILNLPITGNSDALADADWYIYFDRVWLGLVEEDSVDVHRTAGSDLDATEFVNRVEIATRAGTNEYSHADGTATIGIRAAGTDIIEQLDIPQSSQIKVMIAEAGLEAWYDLYNFEQVENGIVTQVEVRSRDVTYPAGMLAGRRIRLWDTVNGETVATIVSHTTIHQTAGQITITPTYFNTIYDDNCYIYKDDNALGPNKFYGILTGRIKRPRTIMSDGAGDYSVEAIDMGEYLKVPLGTEFIREGQRIDVIVDNLLTVGGFTGVYRGFTDARVVPAVYFSAETTRYDAISKIMYEYGLLWWINGYGWLNTRDLYGAGNPTATLDDANCSGINITRPDMIAGTLEVSYYTQETKTNWPCYVERLPYDSDNKPLGVVIQPNRYYPEEYELADEIVQQYNASAYEYVLKNIERQRNLKPQLVYAKNCYTVVSMTGGVHKEVETLGSQQATVVFHNSGAEDGMLVYFAIRGTCRLRRALVVARAEGLGGKTTESLALDIVSELTPAERFVSIHGRRMHGDAYICEIECNDTEAVTVGQTVTVKSGNKTFVADIIEIQDSTDTARRIVTAIARSLQTVTPIIDITPYPGDATVAIEEQLGNALTGSDIVDGFNAGGGTTAPEVPAVSVEGGLRFITVRATTTRAQQGRIRFEAQVAEATGGPWYELRVDGVDWKGAVGGDTDSPTGLFVHSNIPLPAGTDPGTVVAKTLYYRVRVVTTAGTGDWSATAAATATPVGDGTIAAAAIKAANIEAGVLNVILAKIKESLVIDNEHGYMARVDGDKRARMDETGLYIEKWLSGVWTQVAKIGADEVYLPEVKGVLNNFRDGSTLRENVRETYCCNVLRNKTYQDGPFDYHVAEHESLDRYWCVARYNRAITYGASCWFPNQRGSSAPIINEPYGYADAVYPSGQPTMDAHAGRIDMPAGTTYVSKFSPMRDLDVFSCYDGIVLCLWVKVDQAIPTGAWIRLISWIVGGVEHYVMLENPSGTPRARLYIGISYTSVTITPGEWYQISSGMNNSGSGSIIANTRFLTIKDRTTGTATTKTSAATGACTCSQLWLCETVSGAASGFTVRWYDFTVWAGYGTYSLRDTFANQHFTERTSKHVFGQTVVAPAFMARGGAMFSGGHNWFPGSWSIGMGNSVLASMSWAIGTKSAITHNFATTIGNDVTSYAENTIAIGGAAQQAWAYYYGTRSDARDKADIEDLPDSLGLTLLLAMRPRRYRWNPRDDYTIEMKPIAFDDKGRPTAFERVIDTEAHAAGTKKRTRWHTGLIAQEFKAALDAAGEDVAAFVDTSVNANGDTLGIGYTELIAILVRSIQQQQEQISGLAARIKALEGGG